MGHTLSSTVSHFVTSIPSIPLPFPGPPATVLKSLRDRSNLVSWSTASFPTRASPTNTILSGLLVETSYSTESENVNNEDKRFMFTLARARMRGSLSCILPAVSINTTSYPLSLAIIKCSENDT